MLALYPDLESLSRAAAEMIFSRAARSVEESGRFALALTGGDTPRRTYELLAGPPFRGDLPWRGVHVFWGDERCVPLGDARSNALMARRTLLNRVPIPEENIHAMTCSATRDPDAAAARYEEDLVEAFAGPPRLDLMLLGLGENGHVASIFPGAQAVSEHERWVVGVTDRAALAATGGVARVTLTPRAINHARRVVFLVSGARKARALRQLLEGPRDPLHCPAQLVQPLEGLEVLADEQAGSLLSLS